MKGRPILPAGDARCGSCGPRPTGDICRRCFERQRYEELGEDFN